MESGGRGKQLKTQSGKVVCTRELQVPLRNLEQESRTPQVLIAPATGRAGLPLLPVKQWHSQGRTWGFQGLSIVLRTGAQPGRRMTDGDPIIRAEVHDPAHSAQEPRRTATAGLRG